jgi:hypothetical protein
MIGFIFSNYILALRYLARSQILSKKMLYWFSFSNYIQTLRYLARSWILSKNNLTTFGG